MEDLKMIPEKDILAFNDQPKIAPRIGICFDWRLNVGENGEAPTWQYAEIIFEAYKNKIAEAGGQIYILTDKDRVSEYGDKIDGYVIPGGRDIDPFFYGEENKGSIVHEVDSKLRWEHLSDMILNLRPDIPILSICMGTQFLNCYFGGSLHQHLDNASEHQGKPRKSNVIPGTYLHNALNKSTVSGVCFHHQGINKLSDKFTVAALDTLDESIHAIQYNGGDRRMFSVIWHPEYPIENEEIIADSKAIFKYFIGMVVSDKHDHLNDKKNTFCKL